ncbi:diaminopimelate decarboxylase [Methanopyrus sp. SNP6]|uniref:diaminopimelate decarboxylase n=1 Tax=Methanopyrus sp. SNP6 TaxID=1937005 RepID=UPI0011E5FC6D|nr:diaminopimelate decarboxylase [Methanopyrus sp. SNP6]
MIETEHVAVVKVGGRELDEILEEAGTGTPVYVYDADAAVEAAREYQEAFSWFPDRVYVCYAMKANFNPYLVEHIINETRASDVVSLWEMKIAVNLGAETVVVNGNAKSSDEIRAAVERSWVINVDSFEEFQRIEKIARREGEKALVALRVNPKVSPDTHPHIATAVEGSKFGVELEIAERVCRRMIESKWVEFLGLHYHIGSQITDLGPFSEALRSVRTFLENTGLIEEISYLNIGGGLGIRYRRGEEVPSPHDLAEELKKDLKELHSESSGFNLYLEPGRSIVGEAGILVTSVRQVKRGRRKWVFVDAGINALIRPALYDAYHEVVVHGCDYSATENASVAGPLCESGDVLAEDRELPVDISEGDLVVFLSAGAYCESMASNYNCYPIPGSVVVRNGEITGVRRVQDYGAFSKTWW